MKTLPAFIASIAAAMALAAPAQPRDTKSQSDQPAARARAATHAWTGVWTVKETNKPGVVITLADDSGALAGTIVFDIYKAQTNEHIGTEPRTVVNPHIEGDSLAFTVNRILKPHLKGEPESDAPDPTDVVEMILTRTSEGKAMLGCPKCGSNAPTEVTKTQ